MSFSKVFERQPWCFNSWDRERVWRRIDYGSHTLRKVLLIHLGRAHGYLLNSSILLATNVRSSPVSHHESHASGESQENHAWLHSVCWKSSTLSRMNNDEDQNKGMLYFQKPSMPSAIDALMYTAKMLSPGLMTFMWNFVTMKYACWINPSKPIHSQSDTSNA